MIIRRKFIHGTDDQNAAIVRSIDEINQTTGIVISRGEALHLIRGGKSCFNGKWCTGSQHGEIFFAAPLHPTKGMKTSALLRS